MDQRDKQLVFSLIDKNLQVTRTIPDRASPDPCTIRYTIIPPWHRAHLFFTRVWNLIISYGVCAHQQPVDHPLRSCWLIITTTWRCTGRLTTSTTTFPIDVQPAAAQRPGLSINCTHCKATDYEYTRETKKKKEVRGMDKHFRSKGYSDDLLPYK